MKSVLISIQPKWCDLIANGKKTIEVRKSIPKLERPFKVYIYCSEKDYEKVFCVDKFMHKVFLNGKSKGKVIGEFVCDNILHSNENAFIGNKPLTQYVLKSSCLTMEEINQYRQGKNIYAWHISDLKIYDKPRDLSEFRKPCNHENDCCTCDRYDYIGHRCYDEITRPFMSWGYVESLGV